jgi:hypothetical protein
MPPAAPKRRGRGWVIGLSIAGAVLLVCGALSCVFAYPYINEYGATVSLPSELPGGLTKDTGDEQQKAADELQAQIRREVHPDQVAAAFYSDSASSGRPVLLLAATAFLVSPSSEVSSAFRGLSSDISIREVRDHPAGSLGGVVRCGVGTVEDVDVSFCVWADHGSLGVGMFFDRPASESAPLFVQIRERVVHR